LLPLCEFVPVPISADGHRSAIDKRILLNGLWVWDREVFFWIAILFWRGMSKNIWECRLLGKQLDPPSAIALNPSNSSFKFLHQLEEVVFFWGTQQLGEAGVVDKFLFSNPKRLPHS
jgi:hypothetical protein